MTNKSRKQPIKEEQQPINITPATPNSTEMVRVGELYLSSAYIEVRELVEIAKELLKNKSVQRELDTIKRKKLSNYPSCVD